MQVKAEGIEAQLGNNGITLRIADNSGKSIGRLQVGRAKLLWFKGKTSSNPTRIDMAKFLAWLDEQ
jgi:hypothetical protein